MTDRVDMMMNETNEIRFLCADDQNSFEFVSKFLLEWKIKYKSKKKKK